MTAHRLVPGPSGKPAEGRADLASWRLDRLLAAGFARPLATALATTPGIDLHALLTLVDGGCPPALAARILDPVADSDLGT